MTKFIIWMVLLAGLYFGGTRLYAGFIKITQIDVTMPENTQRLLPDNISKFGFAQYLRQGKSFTTEISLSGVSKECEPYVRSMEELDLLFYNSGSGRRTYENLIRIPSACSIIDDWVAIAEKQYLKTCFFSNPETHDTLSDDCAASVFALRAMMSNMLLATKRIDEITELGKLTDLLYAEVLKVKFSPEEMSLNRFRSKQIVDQMLELNPNLKAAKRVRFLLKALDVMASSAGKTLKEQSDAWGALQKELDAEKQLNTMEPSTQEFEALVGTHGYDPSLTLGYASKIMAAQGSSSFGLVLSALGHWRQDDHETAIKEVKASILVSPLDKSLQEVQENLTRPGSGLEAFAPALKINLSVDDFAN